MVVQVCEKPCWLLRLPDELKLNIVEHLDRRRDLLHLSLTCRTLEDIIVNRLYEHVGIEIPLGRADNWNVGPLPMFRAHVVHSMRSLSIRNGQVNVKSPVYSRRRRSDAGSVDGYVRDLIGKLPENQLSSLGYLHSSPMPLTMLKHLSDRHKDRLLHLSMYELEKASEADIHCPSNLSTLECRSVNNGEAVNKLLSANCRTLQRIRFGQERELLAHYRETRRGFLVPIPQPLDIFNDALNFNNMPQLRQIALCGLDLAPVTPSTPREGLFLCNIQQLTLESCFNAPEFLDVLSTTFNYVSTSDDAPKPKINPQLQQFLLRSEAPSVPLKESLIRFLSSFRGLSNLSILLENGVIHDRPASFIAEHGPTLQTLALEMRLQPREHLGHGTTRPFGIGGYAQDLWQESVNDICRLCPNLMELGTGFPWDDEVVRLRKTHLPTLENLHTIHIRNFPESQVLSQLGDYTIKEYATKFVDWVFPSLVGAKRPALETLAIGPTLYENRWKINTARRQTPEFLRTHYFSVDWAKTRFGRWSPLITRVSERYMEELRCQTPLGGVFEQVWLK